MSFRCDRCARCCRHHVVPVTRADVARLATHTHKDPATFLDLQAAAEVDLSGEPESLAELPGGDRLVVLRRHEGACVFLGKEQNGTEACSVHEARPLSCRAYPFDRPARQGRVVGQHPEALCPPETGYLAVLEDGAASAQAWASLVAERDRELHEHAAWLAAFNQRQRLRRRLGKRRRDSSEFLQLLSRVVAEDAPDAPQVAGAEEVQVD